MSRAWQLSDLPPKLRAQAERQLSEATGGQEDLGRHVGAQEKLQARKSRFKASYVLEGRPFSLKNSRKTIRRGHRIMNVRNEKAEAWLQGARVSLMTQGALIIDGPVKVTIRPYYADRRWWLDQPAISEAVADVIKGVLIPDDSPQYLAALEVHPPEISRQKRAHVVVVLEGL